MVLLVALAPVSHRPGDRLRAAKSGFKFKIIAEFAKHLFGMAFNFFLFVLKFSLFNKLVRIPLPVSAINVYLCYRVQKEV